MRAARQCLVSSKPSSLIYVGPTPRTKSRSGRTNVADGRLRLLEDKFVSLVHSARTIRQLRHIHAQIVRQNFCQSSFVATQLISACAPFASTNYAISIFHSFINPNHFIFNALIRALCDESRFDMSLGYFALMLRLDVRPDRLTFPFVLKSAASLLLAGTGGALHAGIVKMGLELDSFVRTSMVDMYVKFGYLSHSFQLFEETFEKNGADFVLLWNVVINGCCRAGDMKTATEIFQKMPERNIASWNSLLNGYMKKGDLNGGRKLFDQMPERNVVSWTTMIAGYSQNDDHEQALAIFYQMLQADVRPTDHTIVSALTACAKIGALDAGIRIHLYVTNNGFKINRRIGNSLIEMYAKCGKIESAQYVFDVMKEKDLLTWSSMIMGLAVHGHCKEAISHFENMKLEGTVPDDVVFLAIITACSHSGLVDKGISFFKSMRQDYMIEPNVKHYACMVDLFGRAGQLEEALSFINDMPMQPDFVIWGALFCACRVHKNVKMAEYASDMLLKLEPKHPGSYIFLSNMYAGAGRWDDVERLRVKMNDKGIEKPPGWSFIEAKDHVHTFVAGDKSHPCTVGIYGKLEELMTDARIQGYTPNTDWILHNIEEEEKEDSLGTHSEKLALAYGLLTIPMAGPIRIVKNLRICGDCHSFIKYASKIVHREIIVRDIKRFHHFKEGSCTCGDYW